MNAVNNLNDSSNIPKQIGKEWTIRGLIKTASIGLLILNGSVLAVNNNLCERSNMRAFCKGNLGIPRRNMPQVEGEIRETYLFDKFQQGTVIQNIQIAAHQLTSVQSEISHKIVISMIKSYNLGTFSPCERSILTAYNGTHYKIMDGHHTAIACRLLGGNQDAIVVFEKNHEVLSELQHLSGSFRRALDDSISKP